jgi:outer membrane protein assembly factor BamB
MDRSMKTLRIVGTGLCASLALTAGLVGCASDGASQPRPTRTTAAAETAFPADFQAWAEVGYRLDWSAFPYPLASRPDFLQKAVFEDSVVLVERNNGVAFINALTGERRWASEVAGPLTKFVGIVRDPRDPGNVIVCSQSEGFVLAASTGTLLAREQFSRVVDTPPVTTGNLAIFGTSVGEVIAHLLGRNVKAWGFQSDGAITASPVALSEGVLCAVSQGGDVMFLTVEDGRMVGRARLLSGLATNPVTDGNLVYIAGLDQSVWCFTRTGAQVWRQRTSNPLRTQPALVGGVYYGAQQREGLVAREAATGVVIWENKDLAGTVLGTRGGRLMVWDGASRTLWSVDPATGAIAASLNLRETIWLHADGERDGNLFALSERGTVGKFIPR